MDHQSKQKQKHVTQERPEDYSRLRDTIKSESFRGNINLKSELYNAKESEYAASIAAAAYAVYSLEETRAEFERRMVESFREDPSAKTNTSEDREDPLEFQGLGGLSRRSSGAETKDVGGGPMLRPRSTTRPIEISGQRNNNGRSSMEINKADAWERARLARISMWYEKMNVKIKEWENEKKKTASLDMERRKVEIERLKRINLSHYQNNIVRIENVAGGARKQLEEKKRSEETYAKQKARKIRATGKVPVKCFCFEY